MPQPAPARRTSKRWRLNRTLRAGDLISGIAVTVALFGLVPQWLSVHIAQENLRKQLTTFERLTEQLRSETQSREKSERAMSERLLRRARDVLQVSKWQIEMDTSNRVGASLAQTYFANCFVAFGNMLSPENKMSAEDREKLRRALIKANIAMNEFAAASAEESVAMKAASDKCQARLQELSIAELGETEYFRRADDAMQMQQREVENAAAKSRERQQQPSIDLSEAMKVIKSHGAVPGNQ